MELLLGSDKGSDGSFHVGYVQVVVGQGSLGSGNGGSQLFLAVLTLKCFGNSDLGGHVSLCDSHSLLGGDNVNLLKAVDLDGVPACHLLLVYGQTDGQVAVCNLNILYRVGGRLLAIKEARSYAASGNPCLVDGFSGLCIDVSYFCRRSIQGGTILAACVVRCCKYLYSVETVFKIRYGLRHLCAGTS